jgi:Proline racemase
LSVGDSSTGTGCSARMVVFSARKLMGKGDVYRARSIIGSEFVWITAVSQYMLDPAAIGLQAFRHLAANQGGNLSVSRYARRLS